MARGIEVLGKCNLWTNGIVVDCSDEILGMNIDIQQGCLCKGKLRVESLGQKAGLTDEDMT